MTQPAEPVERKPTAQHRPRRGLLELGSRDWKSVAAGAYSRFGEILDSFYATCGALGAVIILLIWIYVSAVAVLVAALANRELLRVRQARVSP